MERDPKSSPFADIISIGPLFWFGLRECAAIGASDLDGGGTFPLGWKSTSEAKALSKLSCAPTLPRTKEMAEQFLAEEDL